MITRKFKTYPTTYAFLNSRASVSAIVGPFGSGKSVVCVVKMLALAYEQEPDDDGIRRTRWAIVRNTHRMLRETTIKTFLEWVPEEVTERGVTTQLSVWKKSESRFIYGRDNKGRPTAPHPSGDGTFVEAEFIFMPLDRPDQEKNLLSLELTGAWFNEFREINFQLFTGVLNRTGRYPSMKAGPGATWCGVIADSNPMEVDGAYYNFLVKRKGVEELQEALAAEGIDQPVLEYYKQPGGLDPRAENIDHLPGKRGYYIRMGVTAQADGRSEAWVRVHRDAEYGVIVSGRPIYEDSYNEAIHVSRETLVPNPKLGLGVGMDFGLTPAAVFGQRDENGRWRIFGELVTPENNQMGTEQFLEVMAQFIRQRWGDVTPVIMADPAGQQRAQTDMKTCFEIARGKKFRIHASVQDLESRIGSIRSALNQLSGGQPHMLIDHSCTVLRNGFAGGYQNRRVQTSDERYADKPEKNKFSHVHDACQYLVAGYDAPLLKHKPAKRFPTRVTAERRGGVHKMNVNWNPVA